jgi:hypothetical protein
MKDLSPLDTKPLISILQDSDRDENVRVVMRSFQLPEGADWQEITVSVETRKSKNAPWGVYITHLRMFHEAFEALSWATIALENAITERAAPRKIHETRKRPFKKLQPFQKPDDDLEDPGVTP